MQFCTAHRYCPVNVKYMTYVAATDFVFFHVVNKVLLTCRDVTGVTGQHSFIPQLIKGRWLHYVQNSE